MLDLPTAIEVLKSERLAAQGNLEMEIRNNLENFKLSKPPTDNAHKESILYYTTLYHALDAVIQFIEKRQLPEENK